MSLHHLDPRYGEPCPGPVGQVCRNGKLHGNRNGESVPVSDCPACHGTGRRGGEGEPSIATWRYDGSLADSLPDGWYWEVTLGKRAHTPAEKAHAGTYGPFPTEADALFAARCALAEVVVSRVNNGPDSERFVAQFGRSMCVFGPTRDAALCAALDARGEQP